MNESAASPAPPPLPELVIEAGRAEAHYWRDLWRYRDLFFFLAWRDLAVRYKQTMVGVLWALVQPGFTLIVFTFFGRLARLPTDGAPRAVFVFAALLPWQFFASALSAAGRSTSASTSGAASAALCSSAIVPIASPFARSASASARVSPWCSPS